ncbi:MAG TPA: serine hydrolase [Steroidobacteraceae bacterium]|jgi:beta-lactamase class A|nr:serine hydrolase [Steroidobacteraceae bacterium]
MKAARSITASMCLVGLLLGSRVTTAAAGEARLEAAIPGIEARIRDSGAEVAVAFETLDGRARWLTRADEPFHAASTMKVPVLIELYKERRAGRLRLEDALPVRNEFHSLADGSTFALDPADDSERDLYLAVGGTRTLAQLSELMITVSSNLATNLLIERLGIDNIRAGVRALGADGMQVVRGVEDSKAFAKGLNNTTTAQALLTLMEAIARGAAVDAEASHQMQAILERQTFNDAIPAGLPPGTRVAHKTGEITRVQHDAGIVFAPRPFVLVVLTRGIADPKQSAALIAAITRQLYAATQ